VKFGYPGGSLFCFSSDQGSRDLPYMFSITFKLCGMFYLLSASSCSYSGFSCSGYVWTNTFVVRFPSPRPVVVRVVRVFSALWPTGMRAASQRLLSRSVLLPAFSASVRLLFDLHVTRFYSHSCLSLSVFRVRRESLYNQHNTHYIMAGATRVYSFICSVFARMICCVLVSHAKNMKILL